MPKFYEFTAQRLKALGKSDTISETEKLERLQSSVRDLMSSLFRDSSDASSFAQGKEIVDDCQQIVRAYVHASSETESGWYDRLLAAAEASGGTHLHSSNVATYAALFSIGLGIGKPDELAFAGLLHDIGLSDLPPELQTKSEQEMTAEELKIYQTHPRKAVDLIQARRMLVPENVLKIILQHHERFCGTGYPAALVGTKIKPEAQILAIADEFATLTEVVDGLPRMKPEDAIRELKRRSEKNPSQPDYDPALLNRVLSLFPVPAETNKPKA